MTPSPQTLFESSPAFIMDESVLPPSVLITSACMLLGYLAWLKLRSRQLPLPPGPPSYPIIGQLLSMPRSSEGRAFMDMSTKLNSDIISYTFFGKTVIVLNSNKVAHDLLEKRSSIHSGRFCAPMIASPNLMNMKDFLAFMDTNELWRKQRRSINSRLSKHAVTAFRASQELEVRRLLARLSEVHKEPVSSEFLSKEFNRTTAALFLQSVYGYELKSSDDPFFTDIITLNAILSRSSLPTAFLVNALPWLEYVPDWMPGTGWKKTAHEWRRQKDRAMDDVYNWTKQRAVSGTDDSSIVALTYKEARRMGSSDAEADVYCKNIASVLIGAGTETSTLAMMWFIVAMALHPEVQEKAQREIDEAVGSDRLPTMEDRDHLPYVEKLLTEIVRWHPSAPFGVPHVCTEDNEYQGYRIPKGAIMIGHIAATVRDEHVYRDADKFDPDRFSDPTVPPPQAFGWGLRICPGQHFFREIFYFEVVLMLATLKVERYKDENGKEIIPTEATTSNSAIACPVPFKVKISPRSEQHAELIRTAV
ncbi:O-methylsterigmatocystin oxidoreductase [Rhizoctonia solani 123E]|uniref:O-methylsterigmatocystin oxidoreductase n=1 Tax=Rhizoctonia solani 123E TaxID=1423351 RepID=A0A074RYI0_9AGAM|nr:O-methylsterigmatocystin oxidoreductase [Rhizoctonia solani 123E]